MPTDPKTNVSQTPKLDSLEQVVQQLLGSGLPELGLRELLGMLLSMLGQAERRAYLAHTDSDKGNGSYERSAMVGSIPVDLSVPRTRSGEFRPRSLPPPYERGYSEEAQSLLLGLLTSARSVNAAKLALRNMGLVSSEADLDSVASHLVEELELRNTRPIDPDLLAIFLDAKYVDLREADRLRPACIYLVIGLGRDGKKRILSCLTRFGRENLEDWKLVLRSLIERGLRRVLIVVQDDFSGLLTLNRGLFPNSDVQLCTVHLLRNSRTHLHKADASEFVQRFRSLRSAWSPDVAALQFEELCERFNPSYPTFIAELRRKAQHYLAFVQYPELVRRTLSTTNVVEAVNGQLEILRRNSGGYFHSLDTLKLKLSLAVTRLESGKWRNVAANMKAALDQLNALFEARFESDSETARTQHS